MVFMCSFGLEMVALHETNRMRRSMIRGLARFMTRNPGTNYPLRRKFSLAASLPKRRDCKESAMGQEGDK